MCTAYGKHCPCEHVHDISTLPLLLHLGSQSQAHPAPASSAVATPAQLQSDLLCKDQPEMCTLFFTIAVPAASYMHLLVCSPPQVMSLDFLCCTAATDAIRACSAKSLSRPSGCWDEQGQGELKTSGSLTMTPIMRLLLFKHSASTVVKTSLLQWSLYCVQIVNHV